MASKSVPVAELRSLLSAVSEHGRQHLIEVEADLLQTQFLLNEAIEKLSASFMAIHEAITAQQSELDALSASMSAGAQQTIAGYGEKISKEVNAVVTGMQFQDMTSQLIARSIKRVNGLKESLNALGTHGEGMAPEHEHEEIAALLGQMSKNLNSHSDAMQLGLRKAVDQKTMAAGAIDLF